MCYLPFLCNWKWKWRDIRPSMVTHTWNSCSAFNPSKVHTHSSEHTHTPWTHTQSSGQPFMLRRPGNSWGFSALLKGTSVVVLRVERAVYIHSPHLQSLPARHSNPQPLDYEYDSLTTRPRLPQMYVKFTINFWDKIVSTLNTFKWFKIPTTCLCWVTELLLY